MSATTEQLEAIRRYWIAKEAEKQREILHADWSNIEAAWQAVSPCGNDVLDLGCGSGTLTTLLARANPEKQFTGIDCRASAVDFAQRRADREQVPNVRFVTGDATALQHSDAQYDLVWARFLLEHVTDSQAVLREARRLLRPRGRILLWDWDDDLLITHPHNSSLRRLIKLRHRYFRSRGQDPDIGKKVPRLLEQMGFDHVRTCMIAWNTTFPGRAWLTDFLGLGVTPSNGQPLVRMELIGAVEYAELLRNANHFVESAPFVSVGCFLTVGTKS